MQSYFVKIIIIVVTKKYGVLFYVQVTTQQFLIFFFLPKLAISIMKIIRKRPTAPFLQIKTNLQGTIPKSEHFRLQVNNYEIVVIFLHISHNLT